MKKLLILLTITSSLLLGESKTITINNDERFYSLIMEQLEQVNNKYKLSIETIISISESGDFQYKIIEKSDIKKFNEDVIFFLEEKTKNKFPNLKNKAKSIKVTFTAESINEKPKLTNVQPVNK